MEELLNSYNIKYSVYPNRICLSLDIIDWTPRLIEDVKKLCSDLTGVAPFSVYSLLPTNRYVSEKVYVCPSQDFHSAYAKALIDNPNLSRRNFIRHEGTYDPYVVNLIPLSKATAEDISLCVEETYQQVVSGKKYELYACLDMLSTQNVFILKDILSQVCLNGRRG